MINWINLFFLICNENKADKSDKQTKLGDDKINKIVISITKENSIPKKIEVSGIKRRLDNKNDVNITKILDKKIISPEKPKNWSSLRQPLLKSSVMNVSEVKISEKSIIINNTGMYKDESIFNSGPIEKANNKKNSWTKQKYDNCTRISFCNGYDSTY